MCEIKRYRDQHGYLDSKGDAGAVRFTPNNDRLCDYARPDEHAGLHKHVLDMPDGTFICMACGRQWMRTDGKPAPPDWEATQ